MKTPLFIAVPILVMLGWSCTNLDNPIDEVASPYSDELLTVVARVGDASDTKTAVQSDGSSIYWTEGDAINLFYGSGSAGQFVTSISEPSPVAEFTGTLSVATGTTEIGHEAKAFWAVYPYNAANTCDGTGVTLTIPGNQETIAGSFADNLNPTVATSPGLDLAFYNVGSWFIFSVTQQGITSAVFKGNHNEDIAGTVRVSMDNSSRPVANVQSGIKSITITPASGGEFVPGELYYIVVLPQTLTNGYTLTLNKGNKSADCVVSNSAEFIRSQYRRKRNADEGLTFTTPLTALGDTFEAVDLGLSVKWASFNLGATAPEEYGDYFAWGETEPRYSCLDPLTWKTAYQSGYNYAKYDEYSVYVPEKETYLGTNDDAANVLLGGNWRMPTAEEWQELIDNCTSSLITNENGVQGTIMTSNKIGFTDNSIYLPKPGVCNETWYDSETNYNYWSSSISATVTYQAQCLYWSYSTKEWAWLTEAERKKGLAIRAVYDDNWVRVSDISISESSIEITAGESHQLTASVIPSNARNTHVRWSSSDKTIAEVDMHSGLLQARRNGSVTITATSADGGFVSTCSVTVIPPDPVAVDLGLSVKWASFNLGAVAPNDCGDTWGGRASSYAWGETSTKSDYSWETYSFRTYGTNDNDVVFSKYNTNDNLRVLDPEDDVAHIQWGGTWRMPTIEEWNELFENCTYTFDIDLTENGVSVGGGFGDADGAVRLTSTKEGYTDKSIILPTKNVYDPFFWSSSLFADDPSQAYVANIIWHNGGHTSNSYRYRGLYIRPVTD